MSVVTEEVADLVNAARMAQGLWARLSPTERAAKLHSAGRALLEVSETLGTVICEETHKPLGEALSGDVLGVADLFSYWTAKGPKLLKPRRGEIPVLEMPGKKATVFREPVGVVAVISPWNYPAALPLRVIVPALMAGNAVVFKPSEYTTRTGEVIVTALRKVLGDLVILAAGDGRVGQALIEARPDVVHFTGSTQTGKKVAMACAEQGIPCEMELGGKDAAIVRADANLDRAAKGIAWGIVHNAGQDCASVERVLVDAAVADRFLPMLVKEMNGVAKEVPHLVMPRQREIVVAQIEGALSAGGRALSGGIPAPGEPIPPTLLTDVPRSSAAWRDESFGPIAVVEVHPSDAELIAAANDCTFGLGASIWTANAERGEELGSQLRVGMLWINNHAFTGAVPDLPWVGRGGSGHGITNSPELMMHLTRPRLVVVDSTKEIEPWWYPYGATLEDLMRTLLKRHRSGGIRALLGTLASLNRRKRAQKGS